MKDKIMIVGALYSGNLGDDAIFDVVAHSCAQTKAVEQIKFSISGREKAQLGGRGKYTFKKRVKAVIANTTVYKSYVEKKRCEQLRSNLKKIDLSEVRQIVFDGGQLFFDVFVPLIDIIVKEAQKNHIKVYFNACGIGPLTDKNRENLLRILNSECVVLVTVREQVQLFERCIGLLHSKKVMQVLDPALQCAEIYEPSKKRNIVGIGLINPVVLRKHGVELNEKSYLEAIKCVIDFCDRKEVAYEFFCNGDLMDFEFIKQVCRKFDIDSNKIADCPLEVKDLVRLITSCDRIISFRLHSHIIAASYAVPSFGLVWDTKVEEFFHATGRPDDYMKIRTGLDVERFKNNLENFWDKDYIIELNRCPNACKVLCDSLINT